jgi:hypothetical protein
LPTIQQCLLRFLTCDIISLISTPKECESKTIPSVHLSPSPSAHSPVSAHSPRRPRRPPSRRFLSPPPQAPSRPDRWSGSRPGHPSTRHRSFLPSPSPPSVFQRPPCPNSVVLPLLLLPVPRWSSSSIGRARAWASAEDVASVCAPSPPTATPPPPSRRIHYHPSADERESTTLGLDPVADVARGGGGRQV